MAVLIACVVVLAVLYSFSLNLFIQTPKIEAPTLETSQDPGQMSANPEAGGVPIVVAPETVQMVIASLSRYESYSRGISVTYYQDGQSAGAVTAQVWVDEGWTRTDTTLASGVVECTLVGDGQLWLWYEGEEQVYQAPAAGQSADLAQRLPTYEDVLELDAAGITDAGYVQRDSQNCIYVEFQNSQSGDVYRYWISLGSGLLYAAEMEAEGEVVYAMTSYEVTSPLADREGVFVLPDGTDPRG